MKATAVAPSNIAFIKYWGKINSDLRLPYNSSISMNLSGVYSTTTVEFSQTLKNDEISLIGGVFSTAEKSRITNQLNLVREKAKTSLKAKVVTQNNFPKSAGIASSASGFAALTVAAAEALNLKLPESELTILARLGSGSASRSIPDGFVEWLAGDNSRSSYAYSIHQPEYWDITDLIILVSERTKKISSTAGMDKAATSPLWEKRLADLPQKISEMKSAISAKNFELFGSILEEEALNMHAVMQSQTPALNYWTDETKKIMELIRDIRRDGNNVYFTIDAGPNVHVIMESVDLELVKNRLMANGFKPDAMIVNRPARGARLITEHLF